MPTTGAPANRNRGLSAVVQRQLGHSGSDIETGLGLDTERLQPDRLVGATNQRVGSKPQQRGCFRGGPDIDPLQTSPVDLARRKYRPNHDRFAGDADVDAKLGDVTRIMLRWSIAARLKHAIDRLGRSKYQADSPRDITGKHPDFHP